jgi:2-oxoisovalerate dehydrogenase E1 component
MTHAAPPKTRRTPSRPAVDPRFDWRRIAYNVLVSRALDDLEEATNRNKTSVPREHLILYQFSARGTISDSRSSGRCSTGSTTPPERTIAAVRCC